MPQKYIYQMDEGTRKKMKNNVVIRWAKLLKRNDIL